MRQPRVEKRDETTSIRLVVFERARGKCECCRVRPPAEMDHIWGRAKAPQAVTNCWALCSICHRAKTDNSPSRRWWLEQVIDHATKHGYAGEVDLAAQKIEWIDAKGLIA